MIDLWQTESKSVYDASPRYGIRNHFWDVKILWCRERRYVAIPNMEAWERLVHLAPDLPDGVFLMHGHHGHAQHGHILGILTKDS